MTKRTSKTRPPRDAAVSLYPCMHCSAERTILPWSSFVGFNRKHPLPGMDDALIELRLHLDSRETMIGICPECFCLAPADYVGHDH